MYKRWTRSWPQPDHTTRGESTSQPKPILDELLDELRPLVWGPLLTPADRDYAQIHGLAAVLGFVSNTGIAGLTLGGGFGYMSRRFGWTRAMRASATLSVQTTNA